MLSNKGLSKYIEIFAETEKGNVKINKAIEWSIKDINVASIEEDGWVFAVSQGTTEIICKYNDNEIIIPVTVLSSDYNKIMQDFLKEQSNNQKQQLAGIAIYFENVPPRIRSETSKQIPLDFSNDEIKELTT